MEEDIRKQGPLYLQQQRFGKVKIRNIDTLTQRHVSSDVSIEVCKHSQLFNVDTKTGRHFSQRP